MPIKSNQQAAARVTAVPRITEPRPNEPLMVAVAYRRRATAEAQAMYWNGLVPAPGLAVVPGERDANGEYPLIWAEVEA